MLLLRSRRAPDPIDLTQRRLACPHHSAAVHCSPPCRSLRSPAGAARAQGDPLKRREATFTIRNFRLESGAVMPEVTLAYETYGTLAPDGRNAVLLTHGYTSSQHMAGPLPARTAPKARGTGWSGRARRSTPTGCSSCRRTCWARPTARPIRPSPIPATGKPYGPDFPDITLVDIVNAQKALLDGLGVKHLVAVAGPSFGGYQAFQWGVTYPDFMDGLVAVVSAPKGSGGEAAVKSLIDTLAKDPNWNGGWYYDKGGIGRR